MQEISCNLYDLGDCWWRPFSLPVIRWSVPQAANDRRDAPSNDWYGCWLADACIPHTQWFEIDSHGSLQLAIVLSGKHMIYACTCLYDGCHMQQFSLRKRRGVWGDCSLCSSWECSLPQTLYLAFHPQTLQTLSKVNGCEVIKPGIFICLGGALLE